MAETTDDRFRLHVEALERLEEEKKGIAEHIRNRYAMVKFDGYDARLTREIIRLRKMKPDDRAERDAILETYKAAIGLL